MREKSPLALMLLASGFSLLLGLSVLIGWYTHNVTLIQVRPNFVPMQYNTALGFLLGGIGLGAIAYQRTRLARLCGMIVAGIGALTLFEYLTGINLGIDELLMQHYVTVKTSNPGRMAPNTALSFTITGVFLALHAKRLGSAPRSMVAGVFGSVILALGMVPLFGYLTGVETAYGWGYLTRVAVHTAVGFIALGIGVIGFTWKTSLQEDEGTPRWVPIFAGISILTVSVLLWQALTADDVKNFRDNTQLEAAGYSSIIETAIKNRVATLTHLSESLASPRPSRKQWEMDAGLISKQPGYHAIAWIDPARRTRWIVSDAPTSNVPASLSPSQQKLLEQVYAQRSASLSKPLTLDDGSIGFFTYAPIFHNDTFNGFVLGVFRLQELIDVILPSQVTSDYTLALFDGKDEIYRRGDERLLTHLQGITVIPLPGYAWEMHISPSQALISRQDSALPEVVLGLGFVMALLLALSIHFAHRARLNAARALETNRMLEEEIAVRKQVESDLENHARSLARSNTELEQFAYVASHDLQEPLRMVTSYMQLLEKRYKDKLDEDANVFIGYAVDGAARMKLLITGLLTYSRAGKQGQTVGSVDMEEVLRSANGNLQGLIEEAQGEVTHDPLPKVVGDPTQLLQLLQNLIGNALKFRGEAPARVHVGASEQGRHWLFSVSDQGIGISAEFHHRIFALFQRLHDREAYEGTGIGLALCKKIVESHGGRIWLDSEPGQGCTFYFTLSKQVDPHADT